MLKMSEYMQWLFYYFNNRYIPFWRTLDSIFTVSFTEYYRYINWMGKSKNQ